MTSYEIYYDIQMFQWGEWTHTLVPVASELMTWYVNIDAVQSMKGWPWPPEWLSHTMPHI